MAMNMEGSLLKHKFSRLPLCKITSNGGSMLSTIKVTVVIALLAIFVAASQSPEASLSDSRLTIHTLLREDIFAGFLSNDLTRMARGEKNIEILLEKRPEAKADLLAWKGGA